MAIRYRPEIDGLRTIAVLAVIIYHAEFSLGAGKLLQGGFFGVDVFFVISGFLITSLMMAELQATGRIAIASFYERRVRRLLPVLLMVMCVSLPVAWHLLLPEPLVDYATSLVSSLLFGSNIYWNYSLQQYGVESALLKPFLHTWSLAVEEQYYLIFPLILAAIYRWNQKYLSALLLAVLALSLFYAQWETSNNPSFSFYMLPSRFWELLAGALLATVSHGKLLGDNEVLKKTMPFVGMALITYSMVFVSFDSAHPGLITIVPVLGTIIIILFSNENNLITKILESRYFVSIGLISYSLYLWHYPIFAFGRIVNSSPDMVDKALWFSLTFVLSIATYFLIEKPVRLKRGLSKRGVLMSTFLATLFLLLCSAFIITNDGYKERFPDLVSNYGINEHDNRVLRAESWHPLLQLYKVKGYGSPNCCKASVFEKSELWFDETSDNSNVLIIGDSHSKDLFNAFSQNRVLFNGYDFARYGILSDAESDEIASLLSSPNFLNADIILISMRFAGQSPAVERSALAGFPGFLDAVSDSHKNVIVTSIKPAFVGASINSTLFDLSLKRANDSGLSGVRANDLNEEHYKALDQAVMARNMKIKTIAVESDVRFLDMKKVVCDENAEMCFGVTAGGYKAFFDGSHWTLAGAKYFGARIYELDWLHSIER